MSRHLRRVLLAATSGCTVKGVYGLGKGYERRFKYMASILILGGGFGGLAAAHELRARLPDDHDVSVVAADDHFYAGFAKLWDLVGARALEQGTASLSALERHGIRFVQTGITAIDPAGRSVETEMGPLGADFLLVALGAGPGSATPSSWWSVPPAHDAASRRTRNKSVRRPCARGSGHRAAHRT